MWTTRENVNDQYIISTINHSHREPGWNFGHFVLFVLYPDTRAGSSSRGFDVSILTDCISRLNQVPFSHWRTNIDRPALLASRVTYSFVAETSLLRPYPRMDHENLVEENKFTRYACMCVLCVSASLPYCTYPKPRKDCFCTNCIIKKLFSLLLWQQLYNLSV